MKKLLIHALLVAFSASYSYAQYTQGTFIINGVAYHCSGSGNHWFIKNTNNYILNTPRGVTNNVDCVEAHFKNAEWVKIENVFRSVFPPARRLAFSGHGNSITLFICADATGKIKEVEFDFWKDSCPVTPLELYNLEIGLKALPPLQYAFPVDCSGVNYRVTNSAIRIRDL